MKKSTLYLKILVNMILFIVGILCLFLVAPRVLGFFAPFVVGWIIAMIANPLVKLMEKRVKIVRKHSSAIIIVAVIAAIVGAIYGLGYLIATQVSSLIQDIPNMVESVKQLFDSASDRLMKVYNMLPENMKGTVDGALTNITDGVKNFVSEVGKSSLSGAASFVAKNILEFLLMAIITILSAYFFIKERDNIVEVVKKHTPDSILNGYNIIVDNFKVAVGGYFKAQFKLMCIIACILFIGLMLMGISYAFLFALLIAFLDFLPVFGTGTVLWPWAVIELFASNIPRAICLMVIYLVCQIVRQILQPKMVGDSIGISPMSTLVFMYIGYKLYGALGMIIGIPVGMVIVRFYKLGMFNSIIRGFKIIIHDLNEFRKF